MLREFVEGLDLAGCQRFDGVAELPAGALASALAQPGHQYAVYLFHAQEEGEWGAHFVPSPGRYRDAVTLRGVPRGTYRLEWIDPASGARIGGQVVDSPGGDLRLTTPEYTLDVALRMTR